MKKPLRNAAAFLFGDVGTRLLGFAITVYCARVLSHDGFGMISIGFAALGQLALAASPGIPMLEMRNTAAASGGGLERVNGVVTLRVILALLICSVTWLIVRQTAVPGSSGPVTLLYVSALIPMAFSLEWFFQGKERMDLVGASRITTYLIYGAAVLLLVRAPEDATLAAVSFVIGTWGGAFLLIAAYWKMQGGLELQWRPALLLSILKENLPVGVGMFLSQLVVNFPPLILGVLASHSTVGTFSAAAKMAFLFLMADRLFTALFLPALTRQFTTRREDAVRLFHLSLKGGVILMTVIGTAGILAAPYLTSLLFGGEYADASPILQIMMGYVLLTVLGSVFISLLMAAGETGAYLRVSLAGGILLVAAAGTGAFYLGAPGAAYGTIIGEGGMVLVAMREGRKIMPFDAGILIAAVAASLGGLLLLPVIGAAYGIGAAAGAGLVLIYVTVALNGGIRSDEIDYLKDRLL